MIPSDTPRLEHLRGIRHLNEFHKLEIEHFFQVYKDPEPGKSVEGSQSVVGPLGSLRSLCSDVRVEWLSRQGEHGLAE